MILFQLDGYAQIVIWKLIVVMGRLVKLWRLKLQLVINYFSSFAIYALTSSGWQEIVQLNSLTADSEIEISTLKWITSDPKSDGEVLTSTN